MTGEQLKTWRNNRGLSQEALANYLGWTRDQLANVETERTTMKENIEAKLAMVDEALSRRPPPNSDKPAKPKRDWSSHKCWTLAGQPIDMAHVLAQPHGYRFYRLDNSKDIDPVTNHLKANMYETTRKYPNGQGLFFALDLEAWNVVCLAWQDNPVHIDALPKLNAMLQAKPVDNSPDENKPSFFQ